MLHNTCTDAESVNRAPSYCLSSVHQHLREAAQRGLVIQRVARVLELAHQQACSHAHSLGNIGRQGRWEPLAPAPTTSMPAQSPLPVAIGTASLRALPNPPTCLSGCCGSRWAADLRLAGPNGAGEAVVCSRRAAHLQRSSMLAHDLLLLLLVQRLGAHHNVVQLGALQAGRGGVRQGGRQAVHLCHASSRGRPAGIGGRPADPGREACAGAHAFVKHTAWLTCDQGKPCGWDAGSWLARSGTRRLAAGWCTAAARCAGCAFGQQWQAGWADLWLVSWTEYGWHSVRNST